MQDRVREILGWYGADNPGTLANLARLLGAGRLAGAGRLLILPAASAARSSLQAIDPGMYRASATWPTMIAATLVPPRRRPRRLCGPPVPRPVDAQILRPPAAVAP